MSDASTVLIPKLVRLSVSRENHKISVSVKCTIEITIAEGERRFLQLGKDNEDFTSVEQAI